MKNICYINRTNVFLPALGVGVRDVFYTEGRGAGFKLKVQNHVSPIYSP